jgi:hypothetical protein
MKHEHRIVPGHMGGEYVEGNVIEVEIAKCDTQTASHAMWHYANWRLHGKVEDKIAWRALSGLASCEETVREAMAVGGSKTGRLPIWTNGKSEVRQEEKPEGEEWRRGRCDSVVERLREYRTGRKDTPEEREAKSKASKGKPKSDKHRENIKKSAKRGPDNPNYGKVGVLSPTYGTKRTPEQLEKVSGPNNHQYGKPIPEGQKEQCRQKMKKKKHWVNSRGEHKFQEESPGEGWINGRKWKG